jgi:Uri superfamily endonuclease
MDTGVYSLLIELKKNQKIRVGNLGKFEFPKGFYIYTGSAMNSLEKRIDRHLRKNKKKFWHIDYLLSNKNAQIISILEIKTKKRIECELNKEIFKSLKGKILIKKFGSSDCNCKSHLIYLGNKIQQNQIIFDEIVKRFNRFDSNLSSMV